MSSSPRSTFIPKDQLRELLDRLGAQDGNALAALLNVYRPYLLATARSRLDKRLNAKAGPSDLFQETCAEAHRALGKLDKPPQTDSELRNWLRNILLSRLKALRRRYYRAKRRSLHCERSLNDGESKQLIEDLIVSSSESPSVQLERKALEAKLQQALQQLPPAYRQVILWKNQEGWSFAKIGERMDRSAGAARMLWNRALRLLKKELGLGDDTR